MSELVRDPVFLALTRPQMFAGAPYSLVIVNVVVCVEAYLVTRSPWVIGLAIMAHGAAVGFSLRDPRRFDVWLTTLTRCPRIANHRLWRCNSYRP